MEIEIEMGEDKEEKKDGEMKEWEIEHAACTLMKAEEIKKDAKLMAKVGPLLEKKKSSVESAITSIADLRKLANKKAKEEK